MSSIAFADQSYPDRPAAPAVLSPAGRGGLRASASTALTPAATAAAPAATDTSGSGSTASGAGIITSSDFLTLLVTELKNQDPTTAQDPNAYITQLVQVNSLQQLISINQDLTPSTTSSTPSTSSTSDSPGSAGLSGAAAKSSNGA